jgi:hypothetical protein
VGIRPINFVIDGCRMLTKGEGLRRSLTYGKALPMPLHRAWFAEAADAQQRRE